MKKTGYLFQKNIIPFLVLLAFGACQRNIQEDPAYKKLLSERDSLAGLVSTDVSTINQYLSDFNDIQTNLNRIKEAEKLITVNANNPENQVSTKDQIIQDIQLIYDLLQKNKNTIEDLRRKHKKSNNKLVELEKMLSNFEQQLIAKNAEIEELKAKLEQMNIKVEILTANIDSLNKENAQKQDIIAQKTEELNTAYYAIGSKKELIENKIITKEGGFVGIGKIERLRDDFNKDYFTKIDITQINEIPINASKAKVITSHPANSYKLKTSNNKVEALVILDNKSFWSVSKYLVIVIE
ncbi:MAG: coiled-coil domain-containing protein [Bacteroidales bacterium]